MNASDAAAYLATLQHFWTSTQILAHSEVAGMALEMARRDLKRQSNRLLLRVLSAESRKERAEVLGALDELDTVSDLLAAVHRSNLIVGG